MVTRPLPVELPDAREFWSGLRRGELLLQFCPRCRRYQHYPRSACTRCLGPATWRPASGRGTVYSYSVVRQNRMPPFDQLVPYVLAVVELDEGPRLLGNVTGCDVERVAVGLPVAFYADAISDGVFLPFWRPSAP
ncbi:MAG TPA: Zn-ribbon domain-containing OB-fold protein [Acidimicrobiales bacterium]|nr:Zn-ribbon domain-containing OB-fold protein [Acidimicrobiales bacterium]